MRVLITRVGLITAVGVCGCSTKVSPPPPEPTPASVIRAGDSRAASDSGVDPGGVSATPAPQPTLTLQFRDLVMNGYVAYLSILASSEDGSQLAWGLHLGALSDGCLDSPSTPTILLDLDGRGQVRPSGLVHPESFDIYPPGDPSPLYEERLTSAARVEISGGEPPRTEDGIGHGAVLGTVSFDVRVRDGLILGQTALVDCGR